MRTVVRSLFVLFLALLPATALAEDVAGTATLTVTVLPSPLDAAILPGCAFVVAVSTRTATCNAILIVADPTLHMTGWRATLAASDLTCTCHTALSPEFLTVQAVIGPTLVNGQPVDTENGPLLESRALGMSLKTPLSVAHAEPGYGNGAYSLTIVFRLTLPAGTPAGTYIPNWLVGVSPQMN